MNQWERLAIFFWYICCAASMSWSSEYPLLFILETETQYPLNSLIVLLNLDQWTLSWLVSLLRSGMFLLYSSVICFQNESPFLSFPWIGSLDMFSQAFALKKWNGDQNYDMWLSSEKRNMLCDCQCNFLIMWPISFLHCIICLGTIIIFNVNAPIWSLACIISWCCCWRWWAVAICKISKMGIFTKWLRRCGKMWLLQQVYITTWYW